MISSQTAHSSLRHFSGRIISPLFLWNKFYDQQIPNALALALATFSIFSLTIIFLYLAGD